MKKYIAIFVVLLGISALYSCEEEKDKITYDPAMAVSPTFTSPASIVLLEENEDSTVTFQWTEANYGLNVSVSYKLEVAAAGSNFEDPKELYNGTETTYQTTILAINNLLLNDMEYPADVEATVEFRVSSIISTAVENLTNVISITATPYITADLGINIYLLGSATTVGWDNAAALPLTYLGDGIYEIYTFLDPDDNGNQSYFKFINVLGAWAPQWGTNTEGTFASGTLVYRVDETQPDPPAIPGPTLGTDPAKDYRIELNMNDMTYKVEDGTGLYLLGDGTIPGWDNSTALPMLRVGNSNTTFTITTTLGGAGLYCKFIKALGSWAPQWGTDATGTGEAGPLVYRPDETVPDPPAIPCPADAGEYTIVADIENLTYTITAAAK